MKSITKLSLMAVTVAVISTTAAFADNQPMQTHLALQRLQSAPGARVTTVAAYTDDHGLGRREVRVERRQERREARWERRTNAHGAEFNAHAPAK